MTIRVVVSGATGKMGQECVKAIQADNECELVSQVSRADNLEKTLVAIKPDVVVDFTTPAVVFENALTIIASGAHPVIGTTGLTPEQIIDLTQRCAEKKLGGMIAPNFAIGAVLMIRFANMAAQYYSEVEIIELHHPGKKDKPSGTALKTAEEIVKGRKLAGQQPPVPIHSIRLPGLVACQEVLFGGSGETLSIRHNTIDRAVFMPGVMLACKKVLALDHLVYGLEHVL